MPPSGQLPEADVKLLRTWVDYGAQWAEGGALAPSAVATNKNLKPADVEMANVGLEWVPPSNTPSCRGKMYVSPGPTVMYCTSDCGKHVYLAVSVYIAGCGQAGSRFFPARHT